MKIMSSGVIERFIWRIPKMVNKVALLAIDGDFLRYKNRK